MTAISPVADFSKIAELAGAINAQPKLLDQLGDQMPEELEQVLRVASFPLITWTPFGDDGDKPTCQYEIARSTARNRWGIAGNRSGKTEFGLMEDVADCLGLDVISKGPSNRFKPPIEMWIVSETEEASVEICQRKLADEVLGEEGSFGWDLVHDDTHYGATNGFRNNTLRFTNDSVIDFKYCSAQRVSKNAFAGRKIHKVHFDEEPYREVYSECYARTIDYEGQLLGTMTPIFDKAHGLPWVYQDLYVPRDRKRISFFNWSLFDNPHISETAKQALMEEWDEDEVDARVYGMFTPMGIRMAFDRGMIRELRKEAERPKVGNFEYDNSGRPVFVVAA